MTQFVVHVGPHKTGTSYLQEAFAATRPLLEARGIHYPDMWGARAHHQLLDQLRTVPNKLLESQFAALRALGVPIVLISVEGLTTLPEETVTYLRGLIGPDHTLHLVFYARSWARSAAFALEAGGPVRRHADLARIPLCARHRPPAARISSISASACAATPACFGTDAVRIVSYDAVMAARHDLFRHFAATFLDWYDRRRSPWTR